MKYVDIPLNEICGEVNPELWKIFVEEYKAKYHYSPSARMWTEELVIQWFDRQVDYTD